MELNGLTAKNRKTNIIKFPQNVRPPFRKFLDPPLIHTTVLTSNRMHCASSLRKGTIYVPTPVTY